MGELRDEVDFDAQLAFEPDVLDGQGEGRREGLRKGGREGRRKGQLHALIISLIVSMSCEQTHGKT